MSKSNFDFEFDFDPAELEGDLQERSRNEVPRDPDDDEKTTTAPESADDCRPISVHALGQYVFCPRSSILALETGDETDIDEPLPRLDYLPNFDLERIEEELRKWLRRLWPLLFFTATSIAVMVTGLVRQERIVYYSSLIVLAICLLGIIVVGEAIAVLFVRRQAALRAEVREPSPHIQKIEPVDWWCMLKARFDSVVHSQPLRHPVLSLEGSPWRVLQRGNLRIPVIRSGGKRLGPQPNEVFAKHEYRLAAYAVLLEATEHVESPYGLVFPIDSHIGLAIPLSKSLKHETIELAEKVRQTFRRSQAGEAEPPLPENKKLCGSCPHGNPVAITESQVAKQQKAGNLLVLEDKRDRLYHCVCGDRFGSAPPHTKSIRQGLAVRVG